MHTHYVGCIETRRDWGGPRLLREPLWNYRRSIFRCRVVHSILKSIFRSNSGKRLDQIPRSSEVTAVTQFPDNYVTRFSSQGSMARAPTLLYLIVSSMTLANQASLRVQRPVFTEGLVKESGCTHVLGRSRILQPYLRIWGEEICSSHQHIRYPFHQKFWAVALFFANIARAFPLLITTQS